MEQAVHHFGDQAISGLDQIDIVADAVPAVTIRRIDAVRAAGRWSLR
jgi:hypothetical protein